MKACIKTKKATQNFCICFSVKKFFLEICILFENNLAASFKQGPDTIHAKTGLLYHVESKPFLL